MQEKSSDPHPLSDLAYDWITLMQNKAQALLAYDQYIKDAEAANSPECATFFRKVHDSDQAQPATAQPPPGMAAHPMGVTRPRASSGRRAGPDGKPTRCTHTYRMRPTVAEWRATCHRYEITDP